MHFQKHKNQITHFKTEIKEALPTFLCTCTLVIINVLGAFLLIILTLCHAYQRFKQSTLEEQTFNLGKKTTTEITKALQIRCIRGLL